MLVAQQAALFYSSENPSELDLLEEFSDSVK
jgi:hypothetical protein